MTGTLLTGKSGNTYRLARQMAQGGEGCVYHIDGDDTIVAKIYLSDSKPERLAMQEKKLSAMVADKSFNPFCNGQLRFAWPMDLLYDRGTFVGFTMPYARNTYEFHEIIWPDRRKQFAAYDYHHSIAVAFNLAQAVQYVHDCGYVIGDMNIKNFRFDNECHVIVLDVDSFDVTDKLSGAHYKCCVGIPDYLAPELQAVRDLSQSRAKFSKESDYFSLAILIFQFLMEATHPFNAPRITTADGYSSSATTNSMMEDIVNGSCPYVRSDTGKQIPAYAPEFRMLPNSLQELFRRTFGYDQTSAMSSISGRATAQEFSRALYAFYSRTDKQVCPKNSTHVYLSRLSHCPFCKTPSKKRAAPTAGSKKQKKKGFLEKLADFFS